jgi:hypothetical protein
MHVPIIDLDIGSSATTLLTVHGIVTDSTQGRVDMLWEFIQREDVQKVLAVVPTVFSRTKLTRDKRYTDCIPSESVKGMLANRPLPPDVVNLRMEMVVEDENAKDASVSDGRTFAFVDSFVFSATDQAAASSDGKKRPPLARTLWALEKATDIFVLVHEDAKYFLIHLQLEYQKAMFIDPNMRSYRAFQDRLASMERHVKTAMSVVKFYNNNVPDMDGWSCALFYPQTSNRNGKPWPRPQPEQLSSVIGGPHAKDEPRAPLLPDATHSGEYVCAVAEAIVNNYEWRCLVGKHDWRAFRRHMLYVAWHRCQIGRFPETNLCLYASNTVLVNARLTLDVVNSVHDGEVFP